MCLSASIRWHLQRHHLQARESAYAGPCNRAQLNMSENSDQPTVNCDSVVARLLSFNSIVLLRD